MTTSAPTTPVDIQPSRLRSPHPSRCTTYTPVQQRVIDLLGRQSSRHPAIDRESYADTDHLTWLREAIDEYLTPLARLVPDNATLWVGKSAINRFRSCPGSWLGSLDVPFSWTIPSVRGTVSHKAIELTLNWRGQAEPARMVDAAIDHLVDVGGSIGKYLRSLSTVELAELRGSAVELVTAFEECFPPLRSRWRPVIEGALRAEFAGGKVVLVGRPDLTLGRPGHGGKVIIDFKSGSRAAHHADDLRFYALMDALRVGVSPRRVATVYLDSGMPVAEDVTPALLEATAERVVLSVEDMINTRWGGNAAELRSGPHCGWCPAQASCVAGQEWERRYDESW